MQIKTPAQLEAAFAFLSDIASENLKLDEFEEACGVGMDMIISYYIAFIFQLGKLLL